MRVKKEFEHLEITENRNGIILKHKLGELTYDELDELTMRGIDLSKWVETEPKKKKYKGIKDGERTIQSTLDEPEGGNEDLYI